MSITTLDPRPRIQAKLEAYRIRNPTEVTAGMARLWERWMAEAWEVVCSWPDEEVFQDQALTRERRGLSWKYVRGDGIEIGALHNPLAVAPGVRVRYLDNHDAATLRLLYHEISRYRIVETEILDDGERLETLPDASTDFVVSNHFLEHCQDPIRALVNHVRVLRRGGILYCAVPDCRTSFDAGRERTDLAHLWRDHREGPAVSRRAHLQDWSRAVNRRTGAEHEAWWRLLEALEFSVHYHVWTPSDVLELVTELRDRGLLAAELVEFVEHDTECVVVLAKR